MQGQDTEVIGERKQMRPWPKMGYKQQEEEGDEENTGKTLLKGGLSQHSFTFLNIFRAYFPTTHKKYTLYVLFCPKTLPRFGDLAS